MNKSGCENVRPDDGQSFRVPIKCRCTRTLFSRHRWKFGQLSQKSRQRSLRFALTMYGTQAWGNALYSATGEAFVRMKIVAFSVVLAVACPAFSQTLPRGVEQQASLGGITEYDYPNGLRVLLFP